MRRLVWAESALADFEQAITYLAHQDRSAARLVAERIDHAARQLAKVPTGRPGRVTGTYEKSVARTPYIIAYALHGEGIIVLRVIHSARNWPTENWPE
jgi:toxin ParE1/3/4